MKNYQNTQETLPKLTEPKISGRSPLLVHLWLIILGVGILSMTIATIALFSLTNTGRVEENSPQQTTITPQKTPTGGSNGSLPIILLGAGVASTVAIYKWRYNLSTLTKRGLTRRQQRRLLFKQDRSIAADSITPETNSPEVPEPLLAEQSTSNAPMITVLPPEESETSDLSRQSLAEMMDIRKHLSLSAILQDFKRPD